MEYSYRNELYHHGILGQKWGVRRFQNEDGTWTTAGKARYGDGGDRRYSKFFSDKDTYERIKKVKDSGRTDYMSRRQLESLNKAEKYWKARAEGKKPTKRRGIIKRNSDRYRSYSGKSRYGHAVTMSLIGSLGSMKTAVALGQSPITVAGSAAAGAALGAASGMLWSDFVHGKGFGHF